MALVAVTPQVPTFVYDSVVPAIEQPAVPAVVTAKETDPLPEPPVVERALKAAGEEIVCPLKFKVAWVPLFTVNVASAEVAEL